ncbi:MAG: exo-alpha-sialidase [Nitrospira sp.]|nr:exo-alpha-sialidase [Nitrospira sp.]
MFIQRLIAAMSIAVVSAAVSAGVQAEPAAAPPLTLAAKQVIELKARSVVGPSVQVDEQGLVHLVWMEEDKQEVRTVQYARSADAAGTVGAPTRVNRTTEAPYWRQEAPTLAVSGHDVYITWALTHPKSTPDKPFSTELRLSRSTDFGRSFLPSVVVNDDDTVANHTFDALHIAPDGTIHISWIDPRDGKKDPGTYIARSVDHGQSVEKNRKIDENTCVCCRTALATAPDGTIYVAWRKIFEGNIRETVVARSEDGGKTFSEPVIVGHDRWVYAGCPHRPAALGVDRGGRLYVIWYSEGADETPAVYLAYSDDRGKTFVPKRMLNGSKGTFPDHPQLAVDSAGHVVAIWEEQSPARQEVVVSVSLDRGQTFSRPYKLNEKKSHSPAVSVNSTGLLALAWKEHAMTSHKLVVQTAQLPAVAAAVER